MPLYLSEKKYLSLTTEQKLKHGEKYALFIDEAYEALDPGDAGFPEVQRAFYREQLKLGKAPKIEVDESDEDAWEQFEDAISDWIHNLEAEQAKQFVLHVLEDFYVTSRWQLDQMTEETEDWSDEGLRQAMNNHYLNQ